VCVCVCVCVCVSSPFIELVLFHIISFSSHLIKIIYYNTPDLTAAHVDLTLWPEFHNGVAASLRVGPANSSGSTPRITRNWIIYNRTASLANAGSAAAHAGFLLGLGLLGHLNSLSVTDICDYLTQGHECTTVGVLIGCAASKIGSVDPLLSKTLCLHIPALLPPQVWTSQKKNHSSQPS
jgi:hypothetical protein